MLKRAKELAKQGVEIDASPALKYFLLNDISNTEFKSSLENKQNIALQNFALLDDSDIMVSAKLWMKSDDDTLSTLAKMITNRKLLSVTLKNTPFDSKQIDSLRVSFIKPYPELKEFADYFVFSDSLSISAYQPGDESIKILYNNGQLTDIAEASDMLNAKALSNEVKKYFICYPKELRNI